MDVCTPTRIMHKLSPPQPPSLIWPLASPRPLFLRPSQPSAPSIAPQAGDAQNKSDMEAEIAVLNSAIQQFREGEDSPAAASKPVDVADGAAKAAPAAVAAAAGEEKPKDAAKDKKDKKAEKDAKFKAKQEALAAAAAAKAAKDKA